MSAERLARLVDACSRGARADIGRDIAQLSVLFGAERAERKHDYMNDPAQRAAYVAFWVPQYAAKIAAILERSVREGHLALPAKPRVLDVGAGPLSGTLGVWLAAGGLGACTAVDLSKAALTAGKSVLDIVAPGTALDVVTRTVLSAPPQGPFDLIVVAHLLNELGDPRRGIELRTRLLTDLTTRLAPGGRVLVVEPGTRVHGRALQRVRDELARDGVAIHAPCCGAKRCPLLEDTQAWCHAEEPWVSPPAYQALEKAARLYKSGGLKHSYLLIGRGSSPAEASRHHGLRLVSGTMPAAEGRLVRYACGADGLVVVGGADRLSPAVIEAPRGALTDEPLRAAPPNRGDRRGSAPARGGARGRGGPPRGGRGKRRHRP